MPLTPFHFGPGGLVAVATRRSVSFLSFCAANVVIDVESLYNMLTHQPRIHTFLHTYMGSTLAAAFVVLAFFPARWIAGRLPEWSILRWHHLTIRAVVAGALLGAWSHVLLDSFMHSDITPLAPFSNANGLYHAIPMWLLHYGCAIAGLVALAWWALSSRNPKNSMFVALFVLAAPVVTAAEPVWPRNPASDLSVFVTVLRFGIPAEHCSTEVPQLKSKFENLMEDLESRVRRISKGLLASDEFKGMKDMSVPAEIFDALQDSFDDVKHSLERQDAASVCPKTLQRFGEMDDESLKSGLTANLKAIQNMIQKSVKEGARDAH